MRYYIAYLFTAILSSPTLTMAAETFITAPMMDVTVKAAITLPVCNINVIQNVVLPYAYPEQFAAGGIFSSLGPTDYSGGDIYTPFNITLTNCGSETAPIPRTLRLTVSGYSEVDGVFKAIYSNATDVYYSTNLGVVIFNTDGASARNVLLNEIILTNQTATDSEQVFHFAARFQKVDTGEEVVAGSYVANVSVTAAYE
ncbi:fimbrial protein [Citrobacter sp. RHBSTW-00671]|uniref:fimbrial protein n=1 Tax=Citrobacter sp. RHBSTW-00671 TaxID=2742660 RepID=UPI0018580A36|nr:fimbrial protein [Citrobacter sp. RHBSTW-00671]MBA7966125.1 fimbrial protein [Citrobacter sp. RHBSTW-00671]HCJ6373304.1 fimbrial protein [Citrobacter freundii]